MKFRNLSIGLAAAGALLYLAAAPAAAQQNRPTRSPFPCGAGLVQNGQSAIQRVAFDRGAVPRGNVRMTYVGHMTFFFESPKGVKVATDFNDLFVYPKLPDIATMNSQRGNHSTPVPDPSIRHVLRGWDQGNGIPRHNVRIDDTRVYNVPSNIQNFGSVFSNFSSIFVIEAAGLCIAHLGHLRHVLTKDQLRQLGRIDVALIPVDRFLTQSFEELIVNLKAISPRLIVPMHFRARAWADDFAANVKNIYPAKIHNGNSILLSRATLPARTEVLIMTPLAAFGFGGQPL